MSNSIVEKERLAWAEFAKRLDFLTETVCSNFTPEVAKLASEKLELSIERFLPLSKQRGLAEFPDKKPGQNQAEDEGGEK